jgi:ABC-2 type transport system permease protein
VHGLFKLTWVEVKLFLREPTTLVFTFAFPVVMLFVMGEIFASRTLHPGEVMFRGFAALDYYVPAYCALVSASVGLILLPTRLTSYRSDGVLRRFRGAHVPVWVVLGAQAAASTVLAVVGCLLVWGFGELVYTVRFPASLGLCALAFLLGTLMFAAIGVLLGAVMPSTRAAQGAGLMLFFVMLFLSGAGPPVEVMSEKMLRIGDFLPLTHSLVAMQDAWNGLGFNLSEALTMVAVTVAAGWVALRAYRWG